VIVSGGILSTGLLGWTFSVPAGTTALCELSRGGVVVVPLGPCSNSVSYHLEDLPAGDYAFAVSTRDANGNVSRPTVRDVDWAPGPTPAARPTPAVSAPAPSSWIG